MQRPKLASSVFPMLVLSLALIVTTQVAGAQQFISGRPYGVNGSAYATFATDFDHDGKSDLIVATQNGISTLRGNGDGTFQKHKDSSALNYGDGAASGDFNNDGISDIALARNYYSYLTINLGKSDGSFQELATIPCNHPTSLAAADLNHDGKLDLVATIVDNLAQGITVFLGKGDGTFQPPVEYLAARSPSDVHIADVNGDGKLDVLAIVSFTQANIDIRVWLGNGDGTLQASMDSLVNAPAKVGALADFNEDGILDIALSGDYYSTTSQLALGKGDGHFQSSIALPTGLAPNEVSPTDLNGDGHVDLVIGVSGNTEDIFLGNGDGTFQPRQDYNPGATAAVPGDFNRDGKQDLIIPSGNVEYVMLGRGDGSFDGVREFETGNTNPVQSLAVGDFNKDGLDDLVTGCIFDSRVSVLLANMKGEFSRAALYATGSDPWRVAAGDFNNDGNLDIVTANNGDASVSVLLGNGDGTFQPRIDTTTIGGQWSIRAGDFDEDGNLDLVIQGDAAVVVYTGDGTGRFHQSTVYPIDSNVAYVEAGDVNGDGTLDLTQSRYYGNRFGVLLGRGDGTFGPRIDTQVQGTAGFISLGDFNEDGWPDAIFGVGRNKIALLAGNGDGTFQNAVLYPTTFGPSLSVVSDFNLDGHLDAAFTGSGMIFMPGRGDGTLRPAETYPVGTDGEAFVTADFNGDGYPDLAVANYDSGFGHSISVLYNSANH